MQVGFLERSDALALHHPAVAHKDEFLHLKLLLEDLHLIDDRHRIRGVARKHAHRQRFALRIGEQANDDLQFALFAIAVVAEFSQFVLLPF